MRFDLELAYLYVYCKCNTSVSLFEKSKQNDEIVTEFYDFQTQYFKTLLIQNLELLKFFNLISICYIRKKFLSLSAAPATDLL